MYLYNGKKLMVKDEWFVKITGMLQHNWATISKSKNFVTIYFVNDHGRLFDRLDYDNYSEAKQKLFQNRFNQIDLNDPDSYLTKICPGNVDLKKPMVHHQVYSSGEYGNWY